MIDYQNSGYLKDPDSYYRKRPASETRLDPSRHGTGDSAAARRGAAPDAGPADECQTEDHRGVEHRRDPVSRLDPARVTDLGPVEHVAQYLGTTTEAVLENVPNAVLRVLCEVPQHTRLRRIHDSTILSNLRKLVDAMADDDLRRPRLRYLLEDAERRSRM